ncbi:hypothetical protein IAG25_36250 [Caballeronia sp. EK]|uniref:hypothetical protein n=1 Tax=Caballeronia sp. EK TaxID=2767469 RepID=UPI001655D136|nr:hypothetical protein [Caballeronia sp. EK]MBC8642255.1 hypothetical protein [Caballeronia sp. EK]
MTDKLVVGRIIERLLRRSDESFESTSEVYFAEVLQVLTIALPSSSPIITAFQVQDDDLAKRESTSEEENRMNLRRRRRNAENALRVAERWNDIRTEDEATSILSEDVDRLISRKFFKFFPVQFCLAVLAISVAFAIFGAVRFKDMQFNVIEEITKKKEDVIGQVDKFQKDALADVNNNRSKALEDINDGKKKALNEVSDIQMRLDQASSETRALENNIKNVQQKIQDSALSAVYDLTQKAKPTVDTAVASAVASVGLAASAAGVAVATAASNTRATLSASALDEFNKLRAQYDPIYQETVKSQKKELDELKEKISLTQGYASVLEASIKLMNLPENAPVKKLAVLFKQSIYMVYGVLIAAAIMFILNVFILIFLWIKKPGAPRDRRVA